MLVATTNPFGRVTLTRVTCRQTLTPILAAFFSEMWPVLRSSMTVLADYLRTVRPASGAPLPTKSFGSAAAFSDLQTRHGPLTHEFEIGGVRSRRMVSPYHVWMLQRLESVIADMAARPADLKAVAALLGQFPGGDEVLSLSRLLSDCRVGRERGQVVTLSQRSGLA